MNSIPGHSAPSATTHGDLYVRRVVLADEDGAVTFHHLVAWNGAPDSWVDALSLESPDEERLAAMVDSPSGRHMMTRVAILAGQPWARFEEDPKAFLELGDAQIKDLGAEVLEDLMGRDVAAVVSLRARLDALDATPALV